MYTAELGQQNDELALRAGARLAAAGKRAMRPGGERSAARLLERGLALTRPIELDIDLEILLSAARPRRGADQGGRDLRCRCRTFACRR